MILYNSTGGAQAKSRKDAHELATHDPPVFLLSSYLYRASKGGETMSEIADIVSQVGIPFACFFAMFYLCDKTISSIGELKEVVASLTELIRVQFGGGQDGIQSEDDS